MIVIHSPGEYMYLLKHPQQDGYCTYDVDDRRYILLFTSSDRAEEYNDKVLTYKQGKISMLHRRNAMEFARRMVSMGVQYAVIDFPPGKAWYEITESKDREYGIVDLKAWLKARK